jgi:hypothetical protein
MTKRKLEVFDDNPETSLSKDLKLDLEYENIIPLDCWFIILSYMIPKSIYSLSIVNKSCADTVKRFLFSSYHTQTLSSIRSALYYRKHDYIKAHRFKFLNKHVSDFKADEKELLREFLQDPNFPSACFGWLDKSMVLDVCLCIMSSPSTWIIRINLLLALIQKYQKFLLIDEIVIGLVNVYYHSISSRLCVLEIVKLMNIKQRSRFFSKLIEDKHHKINSVKFLTEFDHEIQIKDYSRRITKDMALLYNSNKTPHAVITTVFSSDSENYEKHIKILINSGILDINDFGCYKYCRKYPLSLKVLLKYENWDVSKLYETSDILADNLIPSIRYTKNERVAEIIKMLIIHPKWKPDSKQISKHARIVIKYGIDRELFMYNENYSKLLK